MKRKYKEIIQTHTTHINLFDMAFKRLSARVNALEIDNARLEAERETMHNAINMLGGMIEELRAQMSELRDNMTEICNDNATAAQEIEDLREKINGKTIAGIPIVTCNKCPYCGQAIYPEIWHVCSLEYIRPFTGRTTTGGD